MKKSEELELLAYNEDNDLVALGLFTKAIREKRIENFQDNWLQKLNDIDGFLFINYDERNFRFTFKWNGQMYDFYPKVNKLLIRQHNKWVKPGLQWIVTHIINPDILIK